MNAKGEGVVPVGVAFTSWGGREDMGAMLKAYMNLALRALNASLKAMKRVAGLPTISFEYGARSKAA